MRESSDHVVNYELLRKGRWGQLQTEMKRSQIDAILSFRLENIRYISGLRPVWGEYIGMTSKYCCLASSSNDSLAMFVDESEVERCREDLEWLDAGSVQPMQPLDAQASIKAFVSKVLSRINEEHLATGKIAIDMASPALLGELEVQFPHSRFIDGDFFMKQTKMIKNAEEIKLLRTAAMVADAGISEAISRLKPGKRECELVGHAYHIMQSLGMERPQVESICASGERTAPLHRMATGRIIQHGDFVFMDMGACYEGYFSDETRTVPVGKPNEKQKDIYRAVYSALHSAIGKLRPGNRTVDVHLAARNAIKEAGYENYGYYGLLGHGIGTSAQEAPVVGEIVTEGEQQVTLQPGMVFTLEPGIFVPGVVGIRLEDNVLITESGADVLTRVPYEEQLLR